MIKLVPISIIINNLAFIKTGVISPKPIVAKITTLKSKAFSINPRLDSNPENAR